jgi:predicted O-methyltransferase YrrM
MSLKTKLREASPEFVVRGYREFSTWYALLTSMNKEFLRFSPPGHFYSPIPDLEHVRRNAGQVFDQSAGSVPGVRLNEKGQLALAGEFAATYAELPFPEHSQTGSRYHLDNEWFSYGDGTVLYSMMRRFKPRRIVEVGSGFSSAAMLDVSDKFFDGKIDLTFIEPYPERLYSVLGDTDTQRCTIVQRPVQQAPEKLFTSLEENDFLFIDSSHVAKAGSDVLHLLCTILPLLERGVLVHIHDVLWPFEYPQPWLEQGRAWNEAYFVRTFLQYNRSFEITYFNSFMAQKHGDLLTRTMPLAMRRPSAEMTPGNGSLWLTKTSGLDEE